MGKTSNPIGIKLTDEQKKILENLVGVMGGTEAEVIRNIFLAWLSEKGILAEAIKEEYMKKKEGSKSWQKKR